jgi:hypothetical protein
MASFGSRSGKAGGLTLYLMVGAFLSVGALMGWLFVRAAPVEVEVVEAVAVEAEGPTATVVAVGVFGANPLGQAGRLITLDGLAVQSLVGTQAFFVEVPGQSGPYLAKMLPEAIEAGVVVENGATVSVTGMVHAMSDSVADAWVYNGGIAESDRILAVFAESFFEVGEVKVTGQAQN